MNKMLLIAAVISITYIFPATSQNIVINEVLASNTSTNMDEDASYQDWIELYNTGLSPINLQGYGLTDDSTVLFKWVFPNVTINPGSYLLIWASDKNRTDSANPLHSNFKISGDGETISLTEPLGTIVNSAPAAPMLANISYGRSPNGVGEFVYFQIPTPNAENTGIGYTETLSPPQFSQNSGFFTSGFNLMLSSVDEGVTILYTLDGSEPDENNLSGTTYSYKNQYPKLPGQAFGAFLYNSFQTLAYSLPIPIVDRSPLPNKVSMISSTYDFIPPYLPNNPIFKSTVVRAKVIKPGTLASPVVTKNYFISPSANNEFTLPIVSLSIDENKLFDYNNGIYVAGLDFDTWRTNNPTDVADYEIGNFARKGATSERISNFSYFVNGSEVINQNIGIRIRGNYSRVYPSKSFNFYAKTEYGDEDLDYTFFSDQTDNSYTRLSLKNSSGDFYHTMFRDPLNHELIKGLRVETESYQPTITFINGEYYGILSLREKYDDKYFKREYGIESDQLDVLENNAIEEEGDNEHYLEMIEYIEDHSLAPLNHYNYVKTQMDTENFQDYFISNIFFQNVDWPGNNIIYWRKKTAQYEPTAPYGLDGRWRWAIHDMDSTFGISGGSISLNSLANATAEDGPDWPNPEWSTLILRKLLENNSFKNDFINRFADLMNTYFHSDRIVEKINSMKTVLEPEMPKQFDRWKAPQDFGDWNYFLNREIDFANQRPGFQRTHIRDKFGIATNIEVTIDVSNQDHGFVKINTIDVLSTTPGVNSNPYPWIGIYFSNIPVKLKAIAKEGYVFSHWEGVSTSTEEEIIVDSAINFSVTAIFIPEGFAVESVEPIYFWLMNSSLPNDTPIVSINSTFEVLNDGVLTFQSCLEGYPFTNAHPNWRKASMERRNSPTAINYIPEANNNIPFASANMRGLQIKQPFQYQGLENAMIFTFSTLGYKDIIFGFTAKDENAADAIVVDYSITEGNPVWISTELTETSLALTSNFQLFEIDFSAISGTANNPNFKVRLRFTGPNMTIDNGDRVTFNNFSAKGVQLPLQYSTPNVFTIGTEILPLTPTVTAVADSYSIEPSLPNGLNFDPITGIISGTPTELSPATDYEVTATNSGGSTSFTLSIEIIDSAPTNLSYSTPNVFIIDEAITNLVPMVSGENLEFSIEPSLPNGLSFDETTGIISGTPTELSPATDYEVTATNSGGSTSFTLSIEIIDSAPTNLSYSTPNVFIIDEAITNLVPMVSGENLEFSIEPSLPNGLSFDETTGIISGTPTELSPATDYEVTATNSGGSTSFILSIEIIDSAPTNLSYSTPNVFIIDEAITNLVPMVSGENLEFSIEPNLPNGLNFDSITGIISGTPTELSVATNYTVTASNSGGSTSFVLSIEVIDVAPTSLTYSTPNVFTIDEAITNLVPMVSGENLEFSIVPSLPNGLSFDETTGIISGTPTELSQATDYEVTATNSGGSTSFILSIEIIDSAPTNLSYSTPNVFIIDEAITNLVPMVSGENLEFSIEPSLPNGLSFDETTGIISGTPTELSPATDYEVTATNSGGSTSFILSIEIIDSAPTNLSYSTPNVFIIDEAITNLVPMVSGENLEFSIEPNLPNGLNFDSITGIISGTPTELSVATNYTVTASNSGGSTSFVLSIEVIDVAPTSLTYSTPNVFTIDEAITNLVPMVSGENLEFSIVPSLPNGLSFDETTGIISGTPTELSQATDYEVTATNSGGSTSFILSIEIIDSAPTNLSYNTPNVFIIDEAITNLVPMVSGENLEFSIEPSLPNGLSFDETTGIISGTPTELSPATDYEVTATNSGGSTSFTLSIEIIDSAPTNLSYSTPNVFIIDEAITNLVPMVSGENLEFSIEPSLPNGLSFDETTGIISGTPTELSPATDYEVTATNSGGSTSFILSIEIIDSAPTNLSYSTPNVFIIDEAITNLVPMVSGENLEFSIEPNLPNGLNFDSITGIISGTPTELSVATNYTVTASNSGGSTSFVLSIEVIDVAPTSLTYSTPNVFTIDEAITNLVPMVSGENLEFSIEPSLPNGLSFDETTGIISGTPTELSPATDYEVTATNSGGSTSFTLSIEIIDSAPTNLSYSTPNVFIIDEAITNLVPMVSGENLEFSIEPSLPNGLSFDETTGIISGTPTELSPATDYEVTATNSGGSTSFILSIEIIDSAPTNLSYSTPNVFIIDEAITNLVPMVSGENLEFSIEPNLPNGLNFDSITGIISGTPTELSVATNYTVTASNSGGSTSFVLSIEVIDVAPTSLTYSTPNVFTIDEAITNLVPMVSGENLEFSIVPSLPNGLSFDETTGIISGTPTELSQATDYEVTATNSGGSTSFILSIEIIDSAPTNLSYNTPNVFIIDEAITNLVPMVSGENLEFSIVPSLPNGLSFDETTGIISGTPTELSPATDYEVTATNSGGSTSFVISIEVIAPLSIDDVSKSNFVIYPNPFKNSIHVMHSFERVKYSIHSADGKLIKKGILESFQILMPELPSGLYLLNLESDEKAQIFKIVKGIN